MTRSSPREIVGAYFCDLAHGRYEAASGSLTPILRKAVEAELQRQLGREGSCSELMEFALAPMDSAARDRLSTPTITDVDIHGKKARVRIAGAWGDLLVQKVGDEWRIAGMPYLVPGLVVLEVGPEPLGAGWEPVGSGPIGQRLRRAADATLDRGAGGLARLQRWLDPLSEPPAFALAGANGTGLDEEREALLPTLDTPVRLLMIVTRSGPTRTLVACASDGRRLVSVGRSAEGAVQLGTPWSREDFLALLAREIGAAAEEDATEAQIEPGVLVALWALADAGLRADVAIPKADAERALDGALARPASGREALEGLVGESLLIATDDRVTAGPALEPWGALLAIDEYVEVVAVEADPQVSGQEGGDRLLWLGPSGARVLVIPPGPGDEGRARIARLSEGQRDGLLLRAVGYPAKPTLAEAFAAPAALWREQAEALDRLLVDGVEEAPAAAEPVPEDEPAPLTVTAQVSDSAGPRELRWLVWPELALATSADAGDGHARAFVPEELVVRVADFCGLSGTATPTSATPQGEARQAARVTCLHGDGERVEGGVMTWLVNEAGERWLLDADEAERDADGAPLPLPTSGRTLARLLVSYLPGTAS